MQGSDHRQSQFGGYHPGQFKALIDAVPPPAQVYPWYVRNGVNGDPDLTGHCTAKNPTGGPDPFILESVDEHSGRPTVLECGPHDPAVDQPIGGRPQPAAAPFTHIAS